MINKIAKYARNVAVGALTAGLLYTASAQQKEVKMNIVNNPLQTKLVAGKEYTVTIDIPGPGAQNSTNLSREVAEDCWGAKNLADLKQVGQLPAYRNTIKNLIKEFADAGKDANKVGEGQVYTIVADNNGVGHLKGYDAAKAPVVVPAPAPEKVTQAKEEYVPAPVTPTEEVAPAPADSANLEAMTAKGKQEIADQKASEKRRKGAVTMVKMSWLKAAGAEGNPVAKQMYGKLSGEGFGDNSVILYNDVTMQVDDFKGKVYKERVRKGKDYATTLEEIAAQHQ